jgi:hypothetical protein
LNKDVYDSQAYKDFYEKSTKRLRLLNKLRTKTLAISAIINSESKDAKLINEYDDI